MDFKPSHPLSMPTDAELFQAMQAKQHSALAALYDRYASLVYRVALRILINPQEAEDLTQEIFLKLWRSSTYDVNRGSLSSFLTTLTRSRAIDKLRSRSSNLKSLQRWGNTMTTQPPPISPFEAASIHQRSEHVREALANLPEKYRQILELAYYEGLSQSEIAARLDIPLGTVKSWSRQGLLTLRKTLQTWIE
ncbi:sigma-70 family RNA polymerase sigma factor [Phormidium sp. CLA17]|uniref:sigma-70 family RNA polymerase sigma factor n=1 Tax=Leptolyngbya sp. Cla-17 TaxID=2803751 RepID=UPI001492C5A9|nr:sigma-70 family RNA polymerase sigma factor [Leptolyngbya sp. Cla-17]MBM0741667.1 sigma-70 family RNA polymerase sigma factor [Leptolyngbya sp. Cla-17]